MTKSIRLLRAALLAPCALLALPAVSHGQTPASATPATTTPAPARPMTDKTVTAVDVLATPAGDLNLRGSKIPALLNAAVADPYTLAGVRTCPQLSAAVTALDAILGPDRDIPAERAERLSVGRVAQSAVGSFIPFRGIIREVSGANAHQRKIDDAVAAGIARRSFLKGYGQASGCAYPAREVTPAALDALEAQAARDKAALDKAKQAKAAAKQPAHR